MSPPPPRTASDAAATASSERWRPVEVVGLPVDSPVVVPAWVPVVGFVGRDGGQLAAVGVVGPHRSAPKSAVAAFVVATTAALESIEPSEVEFGRNKFAAEDSPAGLGHTRPSVERTASLGTAGRPAGLVVVGAEVVAECDGWFGRLVFGWAEGVEGFVGRSGVDWRRFVGTVVAVGVA